jgi:D-glycero-alpha-D-manno-heptose 1-phosphate guanylyltransferase
VTSAVILAGGLGTRLRGVVPDLPKPMAPVAGHPFLSYQLDYWIAQGIERFVLSVGYRHEAIVGHFGASYRGVPLEYALEQTPLGTGGGLLLALQRPGLQGEPFLLLNGDTYFEAQLPALREFHERKRSQWTFCLFRCTEAQRYMGMEMDDASRITALKSATGRPGGLANGGVYLVDPDVLRAGPWSPGDRLSLEDDLMPAAFGAGRRFYGLECAGAFIDIGIPEDYRRAASLLPGLQTFEPTDAPTDRSGTTT